MALNLIGVYLATAVWLGSMTHQDTRAPADVILVLGAGSYIDDRINPCLVARVAHAAALHQDAYAPIVVMSGGDDSQWETVNESATMRAIGIARGIPAEQVYREGESTSTYENIIFSDEVFEQIEAETGSEIRSVLLVTEAYHNPRAALTAIGNLDETVYLAPTDASECWQRWGYLSRFFLREPIAFWYYLISGKIPLDSVLQTN